MNRTKWVLMLVLGTLGLLVVLMIPGQESDGRVSIDNWPSAYNVQGAIKVKFARGQATVFRLVNPDGQSASASLSRP